MISETTGPELRTQSLFHDRFVGVARINHPLLKQEIIATAYAAARHVHVSRRGHDRGPVDAALEPSGLKRQITTTVDSFSQALARGTDLITSVPERATGILRDGLATFALPFPPPEITVAMLWHPRMDADPAHRWLRGCVLDVCRLTQSDAGLTAA